MRFRFIFLVFSLLFTFHEASADDEIPGVNPLAYYIDSDNVQQETTSITDGEAPLEVTFRANPSNMGAHTPAYVWRISKQGQDTGDIVVRYEEETTYRFVESGTFNVTLVTTLTDTGEQVDSTTLIVAISESKLEFPNAFSPNGDQVNDVYKAKKGYRSIVEFKAYIFNRWGQKLFEWDNPADGWDGTYKGHDVKDGVYFVLVRAKGADGRVYDIKKDVNLLRGYNPSTTTQTE